MLFVNLLQPYSDLHFKIKFQRISYIFAIQTKDMTRIRATIHFMLPQNLFQMPFQLIHVAHIISRIIKINLYSLIAIQDIIIAIIITGSDIFRNQYEHIRTDGRIVNVKSKNIFWHNARNIANVIRYDAINICGRCHNFPTFLSIVDLRDCLTAS
nr:MAG TPA: hypothetical protein [Caudoviricetes sp.]DAZ31711.1 MAG TPA: hypothetical protein [Caudoviricetes sp.]